MQFGENMKFKFMHRYACFRNEYPVEIQGIIFSFIADIKNIILSRKIYYGMSL